jgi:hypothetical protein
MTNEQYLGWVPTVIGRYSFRSIGDTLHPDRSICLNIAVRIHRLGTTEHVRYVLCYQKRDLSDVPFPLVTNFLMDDSGVFYFVLLATTVVASNDPNKTNLVGNICMYKAPAWSICKNEVRSLIRGDEFRSDVGRFVSSVEHCSKYVRMHADAVVEFEMQRDGCVKFGSCIINTANLFEEVENATMSTDDIVVQQCYYFLRDISHKHQHHDKASDTILSLYKVPSKQDDKRSDWRRHVLYSLLYNIIETNRKDRMIFLSRVRGVMEYAKSFCAISGINDQDIRFNFLQGSIDARISEKSPVEAARNTHKTLIVSIITGFSIILIGLMNLITIRSASSKQVPDEMIVFADFFVSHSPIFLVIIAMSAFSALWEIIKPYIGYNRFVGDCGRFIMLILPKFMRQKAFFMFGVFFTILAYLLVPHVIS